MDFLGTEIGGILFESVLFLKMEKFKWKLKTNYSEVKSLCWHSASQNLLTGFHSFCAGVRNSCAGLSLKHKNIMAYK